VKKYVEIAQRKAMMRIFETEREREREREQRDKDNGVVRSITFFTLQKYY
jgi:hypothetical protein